MNSVDYNNAFVTGLGGIAIKMVNKTGAASVKGTLVAASTSVDYGVRVASAGEVGPVGVIFESGIADGEQVYVVIAGVAEVLLENSTLATHGNWVVTSSSAAGRVNATATSPPGGDLQAAVLHFNEVGHCLESVTAGTNKLAKCVIHFN